MICKSESRETYTEETIVVQARSNGDFSGGLKEVF